MSGSSSPSGGIGFFGMLQVLFIGLKLAGVIGWSWWIVLMLLWAWLIIVVGILALVFIFK